MIEREKETKKESKCDKTKRVDERDKEKSRA